MKKHPSFKLLLAICLLPLVAGASDADSEKQVLAILKPVADAAMRGDFAAGIQIMYEPLAQELGGKSKLAQMASGVNAQLQSQNLKLVRQEFVSPFRFVQGAKRRYVIVPTLTELQSETNLMRAFHFQLGVEVSPGVWQFVDGTQVTRPLIAKYFDDFPASVTLPQRRQETVPLPIGRPEK